MIRPVMPWQATGRRRRDDLARPGPAADQDDHARGIVDYDSATVFEADAVRLDCHRGHRTSCSTGPRRRDRYLRDPRRAQARVRGAGAGAPAQPGAAGRAGALRSGPAQLAYGRPRARRLPARRRSRRPGAGRRGAAHVPPCAVPRRAVRRAASALRLASSETSCAGIYGFGSTGR